MIAPVLCLLLLLLQVLPSVNALGEPANATPAGPAKAAVAEPAPQSPVEPPKRTRVTCAQYRANVEKSAKHAVFDTRLKSGSWGKVPRELRKLPRKSKLCGADSMGQAVIASPLFGAALESFYTPLFEKVGFRPLECKIELGRTQCTCKRHRDIGIVITDQQSEAFVLTVIKR